MNLRGKGVSSGVAHGRLHFFERRRVETARRTAGDPAHELSRLDAACAAVREDLRRLADEAVATLGEENAVLFEIHGMILEDPELLGAARDLISRESVVAEYAVGQAGEQVAVAFSAMDDDYMRERAADVRDVTHRLLESLSGARQELILEEPVILAADDFSPSETARLPRDKVLALVTREGAANSHTAIFARTMGIPAVIGLGGKLDPALDGHPAGVDGSEGLLLVDPTGEEQKRLEDRRRGYEESQRAREACRGLETVTADGKQVRLFANIGSPGDLCAALSGDAEGIGLFRSEFLYLGRDSLPDEEEQFLSYRKVVEGMGGRQVIIRTLDIGADKQAAYFQLAAEANPALGMRAVRICLERPEILRAQLRAIYRASAFGRAAIMFPMITSVWELERCLTIAREVREGLQSEGTAFDEGVEIGIMIETPAAAVISDLLAPLVSFFSVGTNDLTQYTLCADRQNPGLEQYADWRHPAVMRLIEMTCQNAAKAGVWVGVCGESASDPCVIREYLEMGITELSVSPPKVLETRSLIRSISLGQG